MIEISLHAISISFLSPPRASSHLSDKFWEKDSREFFCLLCTLTNNYINLKINIIVTKILIIKTNDIYSKKKLINTFTYIAHNSSYFKLQYKLQQLTFKFSKKISNRMSNLEFHNPHFPKSFVNVKFRSYF